MAFYEVIAGLRHQSSSYKTQGTREKKNENNVIACIIYLTLFKDVEFKFLRPKFKTKNGNTKKQNLVLIWMNTVKKLLQHRDSEKMTLESLSRHLTSS